MPESQTSITDAQLIKQIKTSNLDEKQKKELADLVSVMTADERSELLELIDESNKLARERAEKLAALNEEYKKKMGETAHEESEYVRKEFEKFDTKEITGQLKQVEAEIVATAKSAKQMSAREKLGKTKKHTLRNLMFTLILLGTLIAGILYGINYL
jgi:hypothetical protein